jgi:anti-sigma B factor antagonist
MQTSEHSDNGLDILTIEGEIDLARSPELRALLQGYAKKRSAALVLDFQGVKYVDSSGLATLVEYVRSAQEYGGKFGIAHVSDRVRTIFDLVRLTEFLPIYPSLAEARTALLASSSGA